jgi:uncharacterized membrane protein
MVMIKNIKRYFGTGILITLPVFVTIYILLIVFRLIDGIWGKLINIYIKKHLGFTIPGIGFILGIITITVIGFIATNFIGKRFFRSLEHWFLKFPLIRQIYPPFRQIMDSIVSKESPAFKKVVLVEYPRKGIWSMGFLTNDSFDEAKKASGNELCHVFIATTPTPFSGFLIMVPKNEVKVLNISIEEGIKLIVSGGIVRPH